MKKNETVVINRNNKLCIGTISDTYLFKRIRMYDVLLEDGTVLQEVRQDRRNKFCATYIDTKYTKLFHSGKKLNQNEYLLQTA